MQVHADTEPVGPEREAPQAEAAAPTATIGRFRVLRALGRGAERGVFLGEEPETGRPVTIRMLGTRTGGRNAQALFGQAHVAGGLGHPHIVPVHEIGTHRGAPFIVYDHVEGASLRERQRDRPALTPVEVVAYCAQVLDALVAAHGAGVLHGGINPDCLRFDTAGQAWVTDFGVAVAAGTRGRAEGGDAWRTRYLAPEHLGAGEVGPRADLFSLGLVLYELLAGRPAASNPDPLAAMHAIVNGEFGPPSAHASGVDESLDRIVAKALEKDPVDRFASAQEMREALLGWTPAVDQEVDDGAHGSTVSFLLRRMRRNSDFPAISTHISEIREKTGTGTRAQVDEVANVILKDFALATKLLKLVNSSHYGQYGGRINTISRAVVILGYEQVRMAALSLLLFEHLENRPQASELKESACRAFLSGVVGRSIAAASKLAGAEEGFVCSMFHTLGRFLVVYYLPDEYVEIRTLVSRRNLDEGAAAREVLGVPFDALGVAIAREWHLPDEVVESMRPLAEGPVEPADGRSEAMRQIAAFSTELCSVLTDGSADTRAERLDAARTRFARALPLDRDQLKGIIEQAVAGAREYSNAVRADFRRTDSMRRAVDYTQPPADGESGEEGSGAGTPADPVPESAATAEPAPDSGARVSTERHTALMNGIQDVTQALLDDCELNDVLVMILETLFRGFGFTRVVFCVADRRHGAIVARFGLGREVDRLVKRFRFPIRSTDDPFSVALAGPDDLVYPGPTLDLAGLPDWYRELPGAASFVLLPVRVKQVCVGAIYCDHERDGGRVEAEHLDYLNTLRNQAALAIKQR